MGKTLFDKIWDEHVVKEIGGVSVLYIDRHYIHEVTSPQAFSGLEKRGKKVFRPRLTLATADHNVPTIKRDEPIKDALSKLQLEKLSENCFKNNIELYDLNHSNQGIVHVIGPELGYTLPGMTIVCGDSHTSTHGAFGTISFGIGTSEVEQVFASQCVLQVKPKQMRIVVNGDVPKGVTSKDIILYIISKLGAGGGTGYFVEFSGSTVSKLSMEARMTICNMSIEMGSRGGLIAPDETTIDYLSKTKIFSEQNKWKERVKLWKSLYSDSDAVFDKEIVIDISTISPMVTYGTNPGMGISVGAAIPENKEHNESEAKALEYMGYSPGTNIGATKVDYVFIGSCTNGRIEDLRLAASVIKGRKKADHVNVWVVPGSHKVKEAAREEGLDKIFIEAGFEFREPGCSACLAMNEDKIPEGKYCVSTSNRNFEGRQGVGARTILASPLTAAASAIKGYVADVREYLN